MFTELSILLTVEVIVCTCFRVKAAWLWMTEKLIEMLSDQGLVSALSDMELLLLIYPRSWHEAEAAFLTYEELVDREVVAKNKELLVFV